jgi:hypothetical protein
MCSIFVTSDWQLDAVVSFCLALYGRGWKQIKVTPLVLPSLNTGIYGAKLAKLDI